ncbi:hypothetical protein [Paenibacillus paeoniae]|uniref:Uncharacterized protein n=1 Tax=Paenibacillus paeoniae TaxID=2292705 RepID=A0A371P733_9BACL|nr:hypothetical protein [Paenibacillus paeoniae]REK71754.1 hypothetical protein DX130_18705 [Paenibacillus paeoniae]
MFELELHDWLPYLLTIGWICAVAGLYSVHAHTEAAFILHSDDESSMLMATERHTVAIAAVVRKRLVRHVKRKDAPEEDDPECSSSLIRATSNQRGGAICPTIHHSFLPGTAG